METSGDLKRSRQAPARDFDKYDHLPSSNKRQDFHASMIAEARIYFPFSGHKKSQPRSLSGGQGDFYIPNTIALSATMVNGRG